MSIESFFNKISGYLTNILNSDKIDRESRVSNPFKGSVDASIFAGKDLKAFKATVANGMQNDGKNSIFFKNINEVGVEEVFDYFDKNKDGKIDTDELQEIAGADDNKSDISGYDLHLALNAVSDKKLMDDFDAMIQAGLLNAQRINEQAMRNYTQNIGGQNYKNYGYQTRNGSTISTPKQFSTKQKLENLENKEIPALENKKSQIINDAQKEIEEKTQEIKDLTAKNKEKLGELGSKYSAKQDEIKDCESKISENKSKISTEQTELHKNESSLSNLTAELNALQTNTDNEEINKSNTERKTQIEAQIKDLKDKINNEKVKIEALQSEIKKQEELKTAKETELAELQAEIKKQTPELEQKLVKNQSEIKNIEEKCDTETGEIDKELAAKREQAKEYQSELGTRTGQAASMTGSKVVQNALALAQQELEKGVYEITGNNDGADIDKYRNGVANGAPWCGSFVSWIYGAGQNSDNCATFGYDASVSGIMQKAANAGYYSQKGTYTPQAGDLMIQKNGSSHVGMVTSVDADGTIHTIEGNSGNRVAARTYMPGSAGYNKISGWVRMSDWQNS